MKMKSLYFSLSATIFASCVAVGPNHEAPQTKLPESWHSLKETTQASSTAIAKAADLSQWWKAFQNPELDSLIEKALANNLDLREAMSRVRESRALFGVARGALLPQINANGSYERTRWSEQGAFFSDGDAFSLYKAGFDASWEIDVFGANRRELEAAVAQTESSVESLRDVKVSLLAELARNYVELVGTRSRIAIARQNLQAQKETAELIRARLDAGWVSELDLTRAQAQVSAIASVIPAFEALEAQSQHRLELLLALEPGSLNTELFKSTAIPAAPAEIPVGLPTEILARRPDLRRAERELAAATARIGVVTSELYPRFFLMGSFGFESTEASDLITAPSRTWSLGPSIRWSLFQGGRIRAKIEVQNARQEQAAIRFEKTLLTALREVEDSLIAHSKEQQRRASLTQAFEAQRRAVDLANERYAQGLVDFLSVLDAQRILYAAHDMLVESNQRVAMNTIALYKALGGGWTESK